MEQNALSAYQQQQRTFKLSDVLAMLQRLREINQGEIQAGMGATQNALRGIPLSEEERNAMVRSPITLLPNELNLPGAHGQFIPKGLW